VIIYQILHTRLFLTGVEISLPKRGHFILNELYNYKAMTPSFSSHKVKILRYSTKFLEF